MGLIHDRLFDILIRMLIHGEMPEKATPKEIRLWMTCLSSLCIYTLFFFYFSKQLGPMIDRLDKINICLPMMIIISPAAISFGILYWLNARLSIIIGILLTFWCIGEIIYRTINV